MNSDLANKYSTDFNRRLDHVLEKTKFHKRSTSRMETVKDIGVEDRRKVRE